MSSQYEDQAKTILNAFQSAGERGLTLQEITRLIKKKKLGHDCINWINTFLEAGILEIFGQIGGKDRYRLTEKGKKALG
jgi:predicted transcriptional regulator